ncbi:radical SAM protein [Pirellulaceae bacterium SH449]
MRPRANRNTVSSREPYAYFVERELGRSGTIEEVATVFLTNRECPFPCVMCDLWKNTLTESVLPGEIPNQIALALERLPTADSIKLYNSGNFFDPKAIPTSDHEAIAELVRGFSTIIVENHPKLCTEECSRFQSLIAPSQFEIAIGLETCHEPSLRWLNKAFSLNDFESAVRCLRDTGIHIRVFLMLGLPYLSKRESIEWTLRSIRYAASHGADCFSIIPTRGDSEAFDEPKQKGQYEQPCAEMIEETFDRALRLNSGRVFVDLWDAERFFPDHPRSKERIAQLVQRNLRQQ